MKTAELTESQVKLKMGNLLTDLNVEESEIEPAEVNNNAGEKDLGQILDKLDQIAKMLEENKDAMERQSKENQELETKLESKEAELQHVKSQLEARDVKIKGLLREIQFLRDKAMVYKTVTDLNEINMATILKEVQDDFKAKVEELERQLKRKDAVNASLVKELAEYKEQKNLKKKRW